MKTESLRTKVYRSLRLDIVSGKIRGGTRITENEIASSLNVSRTPVREALQKLSQEKLLMAIPKAGYMVEDLSDNEIQDLFTTRMEIEQIAFQKAIDNITVEELKNLDDNLEKTKIAIRGKEDFKITELDIGFHSIIYKASRSKSLFTVCKNLSDQTIKYRHALNLVQNLWNELLQEHIKIYQTLITKDKEKTIQAVSQHALHAKEHLMEVLKKVRSDAFSRDDF
ncbi:MAG: GntR family transcriptional regulator [Desulfobacula sp.]|jgi:DNA-binding GntR family transcriptional regulator